MQGLHHHIQKRIPLQPKRVHPLQQVIQPAMVEAAVQKNNAT
jgi:hypothetical protein